MLRCAAGGPFSNGSADRERGFGEVWQAFDLELQRPVAVKVPRTHPSRNACGEEFPNEARKIAKLRHPGIVQVYDVGQDDGKHFIVTDFIDGQDLAALLSQKQLSVRESVRIVTEAAKSLQYAHDQGFIHRDIKPANILMDRHSKVYLADFGIAATFEQLRLHGDDGRGTLAYMSPEQLHGDPSRIDARSDLYGLGVVLYELLTRRHPFAGKSQTALKECVLNQEPSAPRTFNPRIPREVERVCLKCLSKSPVNRYASAAEFSDALMKSVRSRWPKRFELLAAAFILVLVGFIGFEIRQREEREPAANLAADPGRQQAMNPPAARPRVVAPKAPQKHEDLPADVDKMQKNLPAEEHEPLPNVREKSSVPAFPVPFTELLAEIREWFAEKKVRDLNPAEKELADVLVRFSLLVNRDGTLHKPGILFAGGNAQSGQPADSGLAEGDVGRAFGSKTRTPPFISGALPGPFHHDPEPDIR